MPGSEALAVKGASRMDDKDFTVEDFLPVKVGNDNLANALAMFVVIFEVILLACSPAIIAAVWRLCL